MVRRVRDAIAFLRETVTDFRNTGALLPSSRALAKAMVSEIPQDCGPVRVLEVGPGTGVFTRAIVRRVREGEIDLCEINPSFAALLRGLLAKDPDFRKPDVVLRVHEKDVRHLPVHGRGYDYIVSGLPLNGFDSELVKEFFDLFKRLLKPGGTLSYFEYVGIRAVKMPFSDKADRERLKKIDCLVRQILRQHQYKSQKVITNIPPACARHLRFDGHA